MALIALVNASNASLLGALLAQIVAFIIGVVVVGIVGYAATWSISKRNGVDLALAYREIPPE